MPSMSRLQPTAECEQYTVDVLAQTFGTCKCGYAKADHSAAALAGRSSESTRVKGSSGLQVEDNNEKVDCPLYEVNTTAEPFGQCKCGAPKAKHTEAALQLSGGSNSNSNIRLSRRSQAESGNNEAERGRDSDASKESRKVKRRSRSPRLDAKLKPAVTASYVECCAYVVDVRAASFGACKCGNAKVDHSPEALSEGAAERMDAAMTDKWKGSGTVRPRLDSGLSHATDDATGTINRSSNSAPVSPTSAASALAESGYAESSGAAEGGAFVAVKEEEEQTVRAEEEEEVKPATRGKETEGEGEGQEVGGVGGEDGKGEDEALKICGSAVVSNNEEVVAGEKPEEVTKEEPNMEEAELSESDDGDEGEEATFVSSPSLDAKPIVTAFDEEDNASLSATAAHIAYNNNINNAASPAEGGHGTAPGTAEGVEHPLAFPTPLNEKGEIQHEPNAQNKELPLDEDDMPVLEATIVREKSGTVDLDASHNGAVPHQNAAAAKHSGVWSPAPPKSPPPKTGVCCSLLWFTS